jgi:hypothetical protein
VVDEFGGYWWVWVTGKDINMSVIRPGTSGINHKVPGNHVFLIVEQ